MATTLTTRLARAVVAVEQALSEAECLPRNDEAYELTMAMQPWLHKAVTKHCSHEHVDAETFQALKERARRGLEGLS